MFDSHCHLDFDACRHDGPAQLSEAREAGITGWLVPGCSPEQWPRLAEVAADDIFVAVGLHPYFSDAETDVAAICAQAREQCLALGAVAVGECGLDKNRGAPIPQQIELFEAQLRLAGELELPIVIHQVGCQAEMLASLARVGLPDAGGVVHGFGGDVGFGRALIQRGLHLGIGPAITDVRRKKVRAAAAELPLDRLLIETDAPDQFLSGESPPGRPVDLLAVCRELSHLRNRPPEEVGAFTERAARTLFRLN